MDNPADKQEGGLVKAASMSLQKASLGLVRRTLRDIESLALTGRITGTELAIFGRTYLVVDLSDGPTARRYPVSYFADIPAGGWTDEYKTTKLVLRRIPAGTFIMGSPKDELGRYWNEDDDEDEDTDGEDADDESDDEVNGEDSQCEEDADDDSSKFDDDNDEDTSDEDQHLVTLTQDFYIGVFPVTQRQWECVMGTWPSYFNNMPEKGQTYEDQVKEYVAHGQQYLPFPGLVESIITELISNQKSRCRDTRPVECVSYDMIRGSDFGSQWPANSNVDAESFMGRLRSRTGSLFDLPTEAQWEYACRAGTETALNSGKNLTAVKECAHMDEVGRYEFNGGEAGDGNPFCTPAIGTAKVGSYQPNNWGLYDMHGNIWEWCLDWYGTRLGAETNPKGPSSGSVRVFRGGGWIDYARYCRSAVRGINCLGYEWHRFGLRAALHLDH